MLRAPSPIANRLLLIIRGAGKFGAKTDTIHARGLAANPPDLAPCAGRAAEAGLDSQLLTPKTTVGEQVRL